MASKTKAELQLHQRLVELLPKVTTVGLTSGSWDDAAKALVKALAVFNYAIMKDPLLEAGPRPGVRAKPAPKPKAHPAPAGAVSVSQARGTHPHGVPEEWRESDGKCAVVATCQVYKNAEYARASVQAQPAVVAHHKPGKSTYQERAAGVVYTLPTNEVVSLPSRGADPLGRARALARFEELGLGPDFWELEPTPAEVCGALDHLLGQGIEDA